MLRVSLASLKSVPAEFEPLFRCAVTLYSGRFHEDIERRGLVDDVPYVQWGARIDYVGALGRQAFEKASQQCAGWVQRDGVEVCYREKINVLSAAIYVPGVGTLEINSWPHCNGLGAYYRPDRSVSMLESYRDRARRVHLPAGVWMSTTGNAMRIVEAGGKAASVRTFSHAGRVYAVVGIMSGGGICEGGGWAVIPRASLSGPVYTYPQLVAEWDKGDIERGDYTGLCVMVRGVPCVLIEPVFFWDKYSGVMAHLEEEEDEE